MRRRGTGFHGKLKKKYVTFNMGFVFGHECRVATGNEWDVWDNQNARWVPTGIPCYPNSNS